MCRLLRKTLRRGRPSLPEILRRIRSLRRSLPTSCSDMAFLESLAALAGLARLAANGFTAVADALAPVRLRRTQISNFGRDLPEDLFVRGAQDEQRALGVRRHDGGDVGRQVVRRRVRVPERQVHDLTLDLGAVAGTDQLERSLVAFGGSRHHADQQGAHQTLQPRRVPTAGAALDPEIVAFALDLHLVRQLLAELALGALHLELAPADVDGDALRHGERPLADTALADGARCA